MTTERADTALRRAHIRIMKHPETAWYAGIVLAGDSRVISKDEWQGPIPTAYTDGWNKHYCAEFVETLSTQELTAIVLHENFHVFLKHIPRHMDLMREDMRLTNIAMDYAVNSIIAQIEDKTLAKLPSHAVYDAKFHDWSVREIYTFLKTGVNPEGKKEGEPKPKDGGNKIQIGPGTYCGAGSDEHDFSKLSEADKEQLKGMMEKIDKALHQGSIMAGQMGVKVPRAIEEAMAPEVDWRDEMREFVTTEYVGKTEYTWRRYNKHRVVDGYIMPSIISETVGEILIAIDTSGSIGNKELAEFADCIVAICDTVCPESVRVLWWDTDVHGEQKFAAGEYGQIKNLLKPLGGGGTMVECVSRYVTKQDLKADCLIIFSDGYTESSPWWGIDMPTLWLITMNAQFDPPAGKKVKFEFKN